MNLALIIAIIGAAIYLITDAIGKYQAVGALGKFAFAVGLLVWLMGAR